MLAFMLNLNQLLSASKFLRPTAMQLKICSDQIRKLVEDKFQISMMLGLQLRGEGGLHSMREQITDVSIFSPYQWSPKGKLIFSLFYLKFFLHTHIYIYIFMISQFLMNCFNNYNVMVQPFISIYNGTVILKFFIFLFFLMKVIDYQFCINGLVALIILFELGKE